MIKYSPISCPQGLKKSFNVTSYANILDNFKQVQINVPLLDVIHWVASYAKFLKDVVMVKRKHNM